MRSSWFFLLMAGLGTPPAYAASHDLTESLKPIPFIFSGSLEPLAVAVNGKELPIKAQAATEIYLNGQPLQHNPGDPSRSFYLKTEAADLKLELELQGAKREILLDVKFPSLEKLFLSRYLLEVTLAGPFKSATLDQDNLTLKGSQAYLSHPPEAEWFETPHVLEVQGVNGQSRIYNLDLKSHTNDVLAENQIAFGSSDSKSGEGGTGVALEWGQMRASRWFFSGQFIYSVMNHSDPNQNSHSTTFALAGRMGKALWNPNLTVINFTRPQLGVVVAGSHVQSAIATSGQPSLSQSETHVIAGPYLRDEPLRIGSFGITIEVDYYFIRPGTNYGNMGGGFSAVYHL